VLQIGELVKDWRRINVSFTRARSKLIIFGSRKTLQSAPILAEFFSLMEKQGWIYPLLPGADKTYTLTFGSPVVVPRKRHVQDVDGSSTSCEKENSDLGSGRLVKKAKQVVVSPAVGGLLKGRPILRDLMLNGDTAL
jgi:DNA replication ATP-dependent helicase Dna2